MRTISVSYAQLCLHCPLRSRRQHVVSGGVGFRITQSNKFIVLLARWRVATIHVKSQISRGRRLGSSQGLVPLLDDDIQGEEFSRERGERVEPAGAGRLSEGQIRLCAPVEAETSSAQLLFLFVRRMVFPFERFRARRSIVHRIISLYSFYLFLFLFLRWLQSR